MTGGRHAAAHVRRTRAGRAASRPAVNWTMHRAVAARVSTAVEAILATAVLAVVAICAAGTFVFHLGMSPVLTGSMRPAYMPGDALITKPVDVHSLAVGDVAVFTPPGASKPFAHRVTSITPNASGQVVVTTKGDANPVPDAWHATLAGPRVAKVVRVVPYAGRPLIWLTQPWLRAVAIGLLGLIITALGTRALLRNPARVPSHAG